MPRLAANLGFLFPDLPFLDRFAAAAKAGFAGVEYASPYEFPVAELKKHFAKEKVDTQDGIRIDWANAWVHARPSNTEPIMRIIAEAPDRASADEKIDQVRAIVDRALKG